MKLASPAIFFERMDQIVLQGYAVPALQFRILRLSFFNLFLVSLLGLWLRAWPLMPAGMLEYRNILHAHSHFAFGGWVAPVLLATVMRYFPDITVRIPYHHLRNIAALFFGSAFGMLLSFPFQGYGAVSITFSTLSIFTGFYMAAVIWKASSGFTAISVKFLRAGLVYMVLSAFGPIATAPLIANGQAGSPLYFNVIYFYLHFQYNGWFTFTILAALYQLMEKRGVARNGRMAFLFINLACLPAYFLSVLWDKPQALIYVIALSGALVQLIGVFYLMRDYLRLHWQYRITKVLFGIAISFFVLKNILQALGGIPYFADLAYAHRDLVIAYLHMVLLGFVSVFTFAAFLHENEKQVSKDLKVGLITFLTGFICMEGLLVLKGFGFTGLVGFSTTQLLFLVSVPLAVSLMFIARGMGKIRGDTFAKV